MASGQVNPIDNPSDWDAVEIGGQLAPGVAIVGEFKRAHDFDKKKGKGAFGETITFVQRPAAEGKIEFLLWLPVHFQQWETFRPILKYNPTKKTVTPVDIYHPSLADIDITAVVTTKIGNIIHKGNQLYSVTIDFLEYFPPPDTSAVSTPVGTLPPDGQLAGRQPPTADAALQATISQLLAQAQAP